jgi:hypothetical protein
LGKVTAKEVPPKEKFMKKLVFVLAAVLLLTTATVPCFADGNPMPICDKNGCHMPPA